MNTQHNDSKFFKAIIFDLDGTLLDTLADIGDSVNQMLVEYHFSAHPIDAYRLFVGNGWPTLVTRALPETQRSSRSIDQCVARSLAIYQYNWNRKTRPYKGIMDLLPTLKTKGVPMAVLSNKPHDVTLQYVAAYFPDGMFSAVMGRNERFPAKPDPASALNIARKIGLPPEAFLFLGDSAVDMQTALAAGMHAVGAVWGFRGPQELTENGCHTLVNHPMEILPLL